MQILWWMQSHQPTDGGPGVPVEALARDLSTDQAVLVEEGVRQLVDQGLLETRACLPGLTAAGRALGPIRSVFLWAENVVEIGAPRYPHAQSAAASSLRG
jgi:hypothetical protein